jgi:secreted trypsin-like serine protease
MRQPSAPGVQQLTIERIYRHEGYSSTELINDITVIKLRTPAQITPEVSPICLPNGNGAQDPQVGQSVLIAGWGYTNSATKQIANELQQATIQVLNMNGDLYGGPGCNAWGRRGYKLNNVQQICAMSRDTRSDSCQGDSGGPLIGAVESSWYLFGIVSYGDAICGSSTAAGVYTRVSGFATWIQQKLQL